MQKVTNLTSKPKPRTKNNSSQHTLNHTIHQKSQLRNNSTSVKHSIQKNVNVAVTLQTKSKLFSPTQPSSLDILSVVPSFSFKAHTCRTSLQRINSFSLNFRKLAKKEKVLFWEIFSAGVVKKCYKSWNKKTAMNKTWFARQLYKTRSSEDAFSDGWKKCSRWKRGV